ncbi:hypothetical protein [Agrobacterium tumefaciens]
MKNKVATVSTYPKSETPKEMAARASRAYLALNDDELLSLRELHRNEDSA